MLMYADDAISHCYETTTNKPQGFLQLCLIPVRAHVSCATNSSVYASKCYVFYEAYEFYLDQL